MYFSSIFHGKYESRYHEALPHVQYTVSRFYLAGRARLQRLSFGVCQWSLHHSECLMGPAHDGGTRVRNQESSSGSSGSGQATQPGSEPVRPCQRLPFV
jgi:hypothetical protein